MTEEEYKKYKEALLLFYGGGRYILNNRYLPGIPTLPDIQEYTISFTNVDYPDLPIALPDPITDISGTVVTLPTMSGEYEDTYNYYTPESWSIGSFGEEIELSDNLIANLIFNVVPKVVTYTVSFENTTYPDFDVSIPDSIIVPEGDSITLPSVSGEYEDEEYTYTPLKWSIGEFGEVITPDSNLTADLVWNVEPIQTYNIIGGLISDTESIDWLSLDVLGNMDVDNVNLYSDLYQFGTVCVDNIALTQDFYMLGKLMHDYDPAIEDASFVVYDTVEENIVSFYKEELVYSEIEGIVLNSPEIIIGVPQTVPNSSFFFTENGREETNNTSLETGSTLPLYDEYGNLITDEQSIALYYNEAPLSYMKYDGNMMYPHREDSLVENEGGLALRVHDEDPETLEIDTTFGSEVTIPEGYVVDNIKSSALYINNAIDINWSGNDGAFGFRGEYKYFDLVDTSLIGKGVAPCLQVWCVTTAEEGSRLGYYVSYRPSQNPSEKVSSYTTTYLNSNGYSLYLRVNWTGFNTSQYIGEALRGGKKPVRLQYFDENNTLVPYFFDVHKSLYSFNNGVLTWNGDTTDNTDLAYYYSGMSIRIYCKRAINLDVIWGDTVNIPEGYRVESVKSQSAFSFGSIVGTPTSTEAILQYNGKDIYSTDIINSDVGKSILPCLTVFQGNEWHNSGSYYELYGYRLSTSPSYNTSYSPLSVINATVNGSDPDYFVRFTILYGSDQSTVLSNILTGIQTYPAMFRYRDIRDVVISYFFNVPTTLWQYSNGVFSWLGNGDDNTTLAFYYKRNQGGTPIRIRCVPTSSLVSSVKKAWSVQVERVFVLQFSNSEHPFLDIPMPPNETGHLGTVITLPTVTGEYTEEGMVYTPVAWNIGAFGDSYTLNNDVTAILQLSSRVALPTVTTSRLRISNDSYVHTLASGSEAYVYEYVDGSYRGVLYDDVTKKQCIYGWWNLNSGTYERYYYGVSAVRYSGSSNSLGAKNETADTISVYYILYAECSDPTAIVVTVTNSQEALYNSFKYTKDGTTYYYVLDGVQSQWTDDLSSIGYSEEQPGPALPTVYSYSGATQTESSIAPEASIDTGLTYDSGNLYLGETNDGQGNSTRYGWKAEEGPEYEEILMYLPGGETNKYYYQGGVTSSFSGNPGSGYLKTLYSDSELSIPATFDLTKRYEYVF